MVDLVVLDPCLSIGFRGGPNWNTSVVVTTGGYEVRNAVWSAPLYSFDFTYNTRPIAECRDIIAFFNGRRGRQRAFLMRDWGDYQLVNEPLVAVAGGSRLVKTYDATNPYTRAIGHIEPGTLLIDGAPSAAVPDATGFLAGVTGAAASCNFYVPVRFDVDTAQIEVDGAGGMYGRIPGLRAVEVRT